ncbi:phosphatase PAP2 family protein [Pontibacter sp. E15-1]|uniref:phosphatase PAP2 family protein n=1 Tax=Pontibacter sp. E15-1 TaxID=2919918 RepID=UPI001F504000|nr:phosphatase PAP2 family protein [Pontibacter sp. E15-1]MCJ8163715.1 phosphatase PAP2 family protein [Pontibacter sp. E15-1]
MANSKIHSPSILRILFLLIFLIHFGFPSQAQELPAVPTPTVHFYPLDSTFFAPPSLRRQPLQTPFLKSSALITAGATAFVLVFSVADEPLQQFTQSHRGAAANTIANVVQPLGRQRNLAPLAGAALLGGIVAQDQKLQKVGILSLGSIVTNAVATSTLKAMFARQRPSNTTENHLFDKPFSNSGNTSLPSSHTSTAFAVATSVATVYKDNKLVPPIAYGVATLVGLSRVNDNMHWASDVLAGAAVGYVSAKVVNHVYDIASQKLRARRTKMYFTPQIGTSTAAMSMTVVF